MIELVSGGKIRNLLLSRDDWMRVGRVRYSSFKFIEGFEAVFGSEYSEPAELNTVNLGHEGSN